MKSKLSLAALAVLVAVNFTVLAQTNTPAEAPAAAAQPSAADTNATANPAPAATNSTADATATNSLAGTNAAPATAPTPGTNAPADTGAATYANQTPATADNQPAPVIPLIVMDDVPLTDAIRNLARQAGINYMLDPRVGFGAPGPAAQPGAQPAPQPSVSLRWENVTAEQALNALLNNYNLQLVPDPKTKIARVTIKDPAAPEPLITKIYQLKYSTPSNLVASVSATLLDKRSRVMADARTSQLVVVATEREVAEVDKLVERLDQQTKQVLIEARLIETLVNPSTAKGVDWSGTLAAQHVIIGNNALPGLPPTPAIPPTIVGGTVIPGQPASAGTIGGIVNIPAIIGSLTKGSFFSPATAFLNADGVSAVISFLNTYAESKVISAPRTVTLDNEPARIEVTRATPVINVTAGTANTTGGSSITYSNLGVILNVTPRISANNYVNLKVNPEVSRKADAVTKVINGETFQADEYDYRKVETRVMIPSGDTLVIGGMLQDNVEKGNVKVPLLGDIPVLGYLFRYDTKSRNKANLIIFITPTIVQDSDFQPTKTDFLSTPVPAHDSVEPDWSAWDSGKPKEWHKHADTNSPAVFNDVPQ